MKPTFQYFKTWFVFSKGERNGIIFLLVILILIIVAVRIVPRMNIRRNTSEFLFLRKQVDSLFIKEDTVPVKSKVQPVGQYEKKKEILRIELNSSDSAELTRLPGIGPVFASRIIKYRRLLGGFYTVAQLKEVYGLGAENYARAVPHVYVNPSLIQAVSVDTSGIRVLTRHPYIGRDRAWKIINMRKRGTGEITEEELQHAGIFDTMQWIRVKPYLGF
jgi:DNA uptake protein ComE-like DNA-binding protein